MPTAAPPALLHVVETAQIAAAPAAIWAIIRNFGEFTWHPAIQGSIATDGNRVGSIRTLDLGGRHLLERLTEYDAGGMSYGYRITADPANVQVVPVTDYHSSLRVAPAGEGSLVTWTGRFRRVDPSDAPAPGADDEAATATITAIYRSGLDALRARAESKG